MNFTVQSSPYVSRVAAVPSFSTGFAKNPLRTPLGYLPMLLLSHCFDQDPFPFICGAAQLKL